MVESGRESAVSVSAEVQSSNSADWGAAISLQGGQYGATNPDTFVTGVSTDTSESQNIRTIKYEFLPSE